jgi:DNA polymerase-3 subunit epsilon
MLQVDELLCLDVETANRNFSSICQIGVAKLHKDGVDVVFDRLVNPKQPLDKRHFEKHRIPEDETASAPTFQEVFAELRAVLHEKIVFTWRRFDGQAIAAACADLSIAPPVCVWVDAHPLVYRNDPNLTYGMKLEDICAYHGIMYTPHYAASDAAATLKLVQKCLAEISVIKAIASHSYRFRLEEESEVRNDEGDEDGYFRDVIVRVSEERLTSIPDTINYQAIKAKKVQKDGVASGAFTGQQVVITGELSKERDEFAEEIALLGFTTQANVTKKTTILIVGSEPGANKVEKAESYIEKGQQILICSEDDFRERFGLPR